MALMFLPLLSPTLPNIYHTPNKPTWPPVAHRLGLGLYAVQPSLLGRGPPKNTYGGPFHTPPTNDGGGSAPFPIPTSHHLPIPYLGTPNAYGSHQSTDPPPRGRQWRILPYPYLTHTKAVHPPSPHPLPTQTTNRVGLAWSHPDKIPSSSRKPKLKNGQLTPNGPKFGGVQNSTPPFFEFWARGHCPSTPHTPLLTTCHHFLRLLTDPSQ